MQSANEKAAWVANYLPEANYYAFSVYKDFLPAILRKHKPDMKPHPQPGFLGPLWNYLDAACSGILGITQLVEVRQKTTHRQWVTGAKGLTNIANSTQLALATWHDFDWLGGPSFALCFGIGWLHSWDETFRRIRRINNAQYWLADSEAEKKNLENQIGALQPEIDQLKASLQDDTTNYNEMQKKYYTWTLKRKEAHVETLRNRKNELEDDIRHFESDQKVAWTKVLPARILQKEHMALQAALFENLCWTLSFGGMLFLAMGDPNSIFHIEHMGKLLDEIGKIVVLAASGFYIFKHARGYENTVSVVSYLKHSGFFCSSKTPPPDTAPLLVHGSPDSAATMLRHSGRETNPGVAAQ